MMKQALREVEDDFDKYSQSILNDLRKVLSEDQMRGFEFVFQDWKFTLHRKLSKLKDDLFWSF